MRHKINITHSTHVLLLELKPVMKTMRLVHKLLNIPEYEPIDIRAVHRPLTEREQHINDVLNASLYDIQQMLAVYDLV